ncbi:MAG: hypothetical protein N2170_05085 [Bacteroidia bacterium]|nr:hypothetical protein [Bacteroidia bacterium]
MGGHKRRILSRQRGELEYDFEVGVGVEASAVRLRIQGAEIQMKGEELLLSTPFGEIVQGAPRAWAGDREVQCKWKIEGDEISFWIEGRRIEEPLRIDPTVQRVWGTYYGGEGHEEPSPYQSIAVDGSGHVYFVGITPSISQIATAGAHQVTIGANNDAFLVKFSSSGVPQWGTYYGGSGAEEGYSCAVDGDGMVYLAGSTSTSHTGCTNCIATAGAHQVLHGGGSDDAYVVKFSSAGVRQWGTYYGGAGYDYATGVAPLMAGYVFLGGASYSVGGPGPISTVGAHQPNHAGGEEDEFIVLFCEEGSSGCAPLAHTTLEPTHPQAASSFSWSVHLIPFSGEVELHAAETTSLEVYDLQGRLLVCWRLESGERRREVIPFPAGLYVIRNSATGEAVRVVFPF